MSDDLVKRLEQIAYDLARHIAGLERLQRICGSARREALEEAARVAESVAASHDKVASDEDFKQLAPGSKMMARHFAEEAQSIAAAIRALIDLPLPQQHGAAPKADTDQ